MLCDYLCRIPIGNYQFIIYKTETNSFFNHNRHNIIYNLFQFHETSTVRNDSIKISNDTTSNGVPRVAGAQTDGGSTPAQIIRILSDDHCTTYDTPGPADQRHQSIDEFELGSAFPVGL